MGIISWVRNAFGRCDDRWQHTWDYQDYHHRSCSVCGARQLCVGHYSFMDADPIRQWEEVYAEEIHQDSKDKVKCTS